MPMILINGEAVSMPGLAASLPSSAAPSQWRVGKLRVVERLIAAGKAAAAKTALAADAGASMRFDALDEIANDDAQVRAWLVAIGADPDAILAI